MYITSGSAKIANKAEPNLALETQRRHHQKSKTGVPVAPQKGHVFAKNKKKTVSDCYGFGFLHTDVALSSTLEYRYGHCTVGYLD